MSATADPPAPALPRDRRLRLALRLAEMIKTGSLTLVMPDGTTHQVTGTEGPAATIVLKHPRAVRRLVTGGTPGLAEAYIEGWWQSPDLRAVMALVVANEAEWEAMLSQRPWLRWLARLLHGIRWGARLGAARNVLGYYDLGSDFHAAWLDATMTQSAAMFGGNDDSLEAAQLRKLHRLCRSLRLAPGIRVLDLGCGWGSFAEVAARDYGCSVVGITQSPAQLAYAQQRMQAAGLEHRVEVRQQAWREVTGQFDRIAAIEVLETMDEEQWPLFYKMLHDRLGNGGVAALQVTAISERLFDNYRHGTDFIQRSLFPTGMLPTKTRLRRGIGRARMAWGDEHWFGRDYAETLARWQTAFQAAWPRIAGTTELNGRPCDERFKRLWEYYLAFCETGFRAGWTDVGQVLIARN
jgi:cyclopropane-fatty-acyl-phospholipid synthase